MNLNDTFAAVQAAGRHLALLPWQKLLWNRLPTSSLRTGKIWNGCHPTIRNTTG